MNKVIGKALLVLGLLSLCGQLFAAPGVAAKTEGYHYYRDDVSDVPWSIQVLRVNRSDTNLQFHTSLARGNTIGLIPLPEQIQSLPPDLGRPIAAINGDYYLDREPYIGDPKGIQICRGELISAPCDWTCFWVDAEGQPHMGKVTSKFTVTWPDGQKSSLGLNEPRTPSRCVLYTAAVGPSTRTSGGMELVLERGSVAKLLPLQVGEDYSVVVREVRQQGNTRTGKDTVVLSIGPKLMKKLPPIGKGARLRISTQTEPSLHGAETAISGGPALVREGKVQVGWSAIRHPRSAIGWNKDHLYLVQVDGRQSGFSVGMTYSELASYMVKLGCDEALNLDGGGSATFWALGHVMNSPSEGQARGVANGLVLIQKEPAETNALTVPAESGKDNVD